jgi:hypothetical protein
VPGLGSRVVVSVPLLVEEPDEVPVMAPLGGGEVQVSKTLSQLISPLSLSSMTGWVEANQAIMTTITTCAIPYF